MKIRAIFYDLDGTLRLSSPDSWRVFILHAEELGFSIDPQEAFRIARWEHYYFAESPEVIADRRVFKGGAFWLNFCQRELQEMGASEKQISELSPVLMKYMDENYHPVDIVPSDLADTLSILKERGYMLGVLSNRDVAFSDYLDKLGLGEYFSLSIPAGDVGVFKPNPKVFEYLLEKAGVSADEAMYVGDNYYADVVGSRNAGMSPVLLDIHGLFDDPGCPVIQSHSQILELLN